MTNMVANVPSPGRRIAVLVPPAERSFGQKFEAKFFWCLSAVFWSYVILSNFVFSLDLLLVERLPESIQWVVRYKIFSFLMALAVFILITRKGQLLFYPIYIVVFPVTRIVFVFIFIFKQKSWAMLFV